MILPLDHSGKSKSLYNSTQSSAVNGSMGALLCKVAKSSPVDDFLQRAWIIQVGVKEAREKYQSKSFKSTVDLGLINEVHDIDEAGFQVLHERSSWGVSLYPDQIKRTIRTKKITNIRMIIQEVMDTDDLFMLDPRIETIVFFDFRVRVSAFYDPPPPDINGGVKSHDLHIMTHHFIEPRLQILLFIATKQGSSLAKDTFGVIADMAAYYLEEITVVDLILNKSKQHSPSTKDVVVLSVATWMHKPRPPFDEKAVQRDTYNELVRMLRQEAESFPAVMEALWKGLEFESCLTTPERFFNEDIMLERLLHYQLIESALQHNERIAQQRRKDNQAIAQQLRGLQGANLIQRNARAINDIYDALNPDGIRYGHDARWFRNLFDALSDAHAAKERLVFGEHGDVQLLDNPGMKDVPTLLRLRYVEALISRRRQFVQAVADTVWKCKALGLPEGVANDLQNVRLAVGIQRPSLIANNGAARGLKILEKVLTKIQRSPTQSTASEMAAYEPPAVTPL